jgi:hypothetical protein
MTTQQETLTLAAQVVDQFSAPLRDLTKQLKSFFRPAARYQPSRQGRH